MFKAEQMEDKWDIYLYDRHLYFCRSWRGELVFRANIEFEEDKVTVTTVEASPTGDGGLVLQQVNFLINSHLVGLKVLHPLPKKLL